MKKQICIIHGGNVHDSYDEFQTVLANLQLDYDYLLPQVSWKNWLPQQLPQTDVLLPSMPNKQNASYSDWSTYFAKVLPFLNSDASLIGHSLGGIFLARFLSDNPPKTPFKQLILVAAPYDDATSEPLGAFKLDSASKLNNAAQQIDLFFSRDDPAVPVSELDKYKHDLPEAKVHLFDNYGHFNQPTFPELLAILN